MASVVPLLGAGSAAPVSSPACEFATLTIGDKSGILPLGTGTNGWGTNPRSFDTEKLGGAFARALELGVTIFDTAQLYNSGESESSLGNFNQVHGKSAVLMSKFNALGKSAKNLVPSLRESLGRCQVEYLDVFFIHHPKGDPKVLVAELKKAFEEGMIRAVGVSNYGAKALRDFHAMLSEVGVPLAFNEVEYSLLRRSPETTGLLKVCEELDVKVVAWAPLAQGRLTGVMNDKIANRATKEVIRELSAIATARGKTMGQVALNWCCCKGTIPIPGARSRARVEENAGGVIGWRLTTEEVGRLDAVAVDEGGFYRDPEAIFAFGGWPMWLFRPLLRCLLRFILMLARCLLPLQE